MIYLFSQIYLPKPNPNCLEWSKQQEALVSTWTQVNQSFKRDGDISTLSGRPLKFVDNTTYLGSYITSTESDVNIHLAKAWTAIDRLSIIWKSDVSYKIKQDIFQALVVSILLYGSTTWTLTKRTKKKLDGSYTRMLCAILNNPGRNTSQNSSCIDIYLPSHKSSKYDEQDMRGTTEIVRMNS